MTKNIHSINYDREILPFVEKPGRYAGHEFNIRCKDLSNVKASIVLAYPDLYDVGMSYYGFQVLYHILNRDSEVAAERVYAPWPDFERQLRKHSIPLYSLESHTSLHQFDIVGFTLSYELTFTNILNMLDLFGIPIWSDQRKVDDPFVIAGGVGAYNPEPLAPFIDFFVVGDAEEVIVSIVKFVADKRRKKVPRTEILKELASRFSGIYVPALYEVNKGKKGLLDPPISKFDYIPEKVKSIRVSKLLSDFYPDSPVMPLVGITQDRLVIEIMRGCTQGCRFCQAGMIYRPVRERPPEDIVSQIQESLPKTGYNDISLLSLSTSDYTGLDDIVRKISGDLIAQHTSISLPSLRLDSFTESIAKLAQYTRKSGLTFAPEAGSSRLRQAINKHITDDELLQSTEIALRNGWRLLKLYYMLGLPTETEADIDAIAELSRKVIRVGNGRLSLNITLSTFIPKPFTPFQWEEQNSVEKIQSKLDTIKPALWSLRKVKVMSNDPVYSRLEGVISRGDRRIANVIFEAWKHGAKFDSWREYFSAEIWDKAFKKAGVDSQEYISGREEDKPLSWDIIDPLISKNYLLSEREKSYIGETTPDCRSGCTGCGVCKPNILDMIIVGSKKETTSNYLVEKGGGKFSPIKYRMKYRKGEEIRFTSQLDILRIFQQALRRAKLNLIYSQGFSKRPKISSGFSLPLGYTSDEEYIEITLKNRVPKLCERININLPDGLKVISSLEIPIKSPAISNLVNGIDYEVNFHTELPGNINYLINNLLSKKEFVVNRERGKKPKRIDIRRYISSIAEGDKKLLIKVNVEDGSTVRISEILETLSLEKFSLQVHRLKIYLKE